ncbi:MAG: HNH endonuclease family protein [Micrococcales bacterium]|nr:HNH endonuclease family protein [Micrococcales bacterium]
MAWDLRKLGIVVAVAMVWPVAGCVIHEAEDDPTSVVTTTGPTNTIEPTITVEPTIEPTVEPTVEPTPDITILPTPIFSPQSRDARLLGPELVTGILAHSLPGEDTPAWAFKALDDLELAAEPVGAYKRTEFPHWKGASVTDWGWAAKPGGCNARQASLIRDAETVTVGAKCKVESGTWTDPYTLQVLTSPTQIDIDHVVPLAAAWRTGAWEWDKATRQKFANDPLVLVSVLASANRAKGDKAPQDWEPANKQALCSYAVRWVAIKATYNLGLESQAERTSLEGMLGTCQDVDELDPVETDPPPIL